MLPVQLYESKSLLRFNDECKMRITTKMPIGVLKMSIYDRDWYREDYKRRQQAQEQSSSGIPPRKDPPVKTMLKDREPSDDGTTVLVPAVCANCLNNIQVRLPKRIPYEYSFTCPKCGKTTTVKTDQGKKAKSYVTEHIASIIIYPLMAFLFSGVYGQATVPSPLYNILMLCVGIILFAQAVIRRKKGADKGLLNALDMVFTLFPAVCFSGVALASYIMIHPL